MKKHALLAAVALALASVAQASGDHHDPKYGGVVAESKAFDLELVARPASVQLYLRDHGGQPVDVSTSSARLTLLTGAEKQEVALKPAGREKLEASGSFKVGAGTKAVVVVTHAGQAATARFTLK